MPPGAHGTLDLGLPPDWRDAGAPSLTATDPTGRLVNVWSWMLRGRGDIARRSVDAASAYGPESQLNLVNGRTGTYTGTLHFAFGPADRK